jgi:hypothetical protein
MEYFVNFAYHIDFSFNFYATWSNLKIRSIIWTNFTFIFFKKIIIKKNQTIILINLDYS